MNEKLKNELIELCRSYCERIGPNPTGVEKLQVMYRIKRGEKRSFNEAYLAVVLQGQKRTFIGSQEYCYGPGSCVVTCLDLPSHTYIEEASEEKPFISAVLTLDRELLCGLSQKLSSLDSVAHFKESDGQAMAVAPCSDELAMCFVKLLKLGRSSKREISFLQDIFIRETLSRVLLGDLGPWIRLVCHYGSHSGQVFNAVKIIKDQFKENILIEELAESVHMSPASLHRHFKNLTGCSPIQFQKSLKMYEAKRLFLSGKKSVSAAAFELGYASASQLTTDYKKFFKISPTEEMAQAAQNE